MQKHTNSNRMARVNEELKREVSNIINYEVKNSNVTGMISVTKVKTTPDFKYAKVSVSIINSKNVKQTLAGLTPEIVFELDESLVYGERIDKILQEVMKEINENNKEN